MCTSIQRLGAAVIALALSGTAVWADAGTCGRHSDGDLIGNYAAHLFNGLVFGRPIADVDANATLWALDGGLGLSLEGGGMQGGLEIPLKRVSAGKRVAFNSKITIGKQASLHDLATVTECDSADGFPQYFGTGHIISADGKSIPATLRMHLWFAPKHAGGPQELAGVGVVRSEVLNGMIQLSGS